MEEKIKLNYCVISVPPALGVAEINGVNVVEETLCSKSFTYDSLVLVILVKYKDETLGAWENVNC